MHMKIRTAAAALALAALIGTSPRATTPLMPVSEIRAGMVGVGRTVFQGAELEDFKVHIIGVLRNVQGPRRDLILARLEGGPLAETGVAAGMSGSPVYIDGRLVGAVGYSIGAFPKEAIAGITPIEEMKEATAQASTRRAAVKTPIALPVTSETFEAALKASYAALSAPGMSSSPDTLGISRTDAAHLAANLRPIAIPLVMSGFTPDAVQLATRMFSDAGLAPVLSGFGGAASREVNDSMK